MKNRDRFSRKSYAMRRMTLAIERAIGRPTSKEKERAARWAAAWGLLCGIRTEGVKLRCSDIQDLEERIRRSSDQIEISGPPTWSGMENTAGLCESDIQLRSPSSLSQEAPPSLPAFSTQQMRLSELRDEDHEP